MAGEGSNDFPVSFNVILKCIRNLMAIGRDGMNETDRVVLGIMTHKC